MDIDALIAGWEQAKDAEQKAVAARREIEDQLISVLGIDETLAGTKTFGPLKVVSRLNQTIDADQLQEIAAESGLQDHLSALFNWKPTINARAWKACDELITSVLARAITEKPGRPTFSLVRKEQ